MLTLGLTGTIHLAVVPVDGRKGIDGLSGVVRAVIGRDPSNDDLFVFKNLRGGTFKILARMGDVTKYDVLLTGGGRSYETTTQLLLTSVLTTQQKHCDLHSFAWTCTRLDEQLY
jgi:hypothetical protein